jgi:hypothetical protein
MQRCFGKSDVATKWDLLVRDFGSFFGSGRKSILII